MAKVRAARGKKKGGCAACPKRGDGNMADAKAALMKVAAGNKKLAEKKRLDSIRKASMKDTQLGEGPKIDAIISAARKAAEAAKKAAAFVKKHENTIKSGLRTGTEIAGAVGSLTGSKTLQTIGSARSLLGKGQRGRGPGVNTGMMATPAISYPNSAAPFTGVLVF